MTSLPVFNCTRCGACCRRAGTTKELAHWNRGDGGCRHLTADNTCAIYDDRPAVCRIDATQPSHMTTTQWFEANERACEQLRDALDGGDTCPPR